VEQLRYGALADEIADSKTTCTHSSRPLEPGGRSRHAAGAAGPAHDDPADDPVRWIFYTSGNDRGAEGRAAHPIARCSRAQIGYAQKTHVVEDDIALVAFPFTHVGGIIIGVSRRCSPAPRGAHGGWTTARIDRVDPQAPGRRSPTGAAAIHAALITAKVITMATVRVDRARSPYAEPIGK